MNAEKNSAFLFGEAVSQFDKPLRRLGVNIHRIVEGCHPFAIVGEVNHNVDAYLKDCNAVPIVTQIKKNFANMLSRDSKRYESNINSNQIGHGKEVDVCNCSDYLIVNLAGVLRPLYKIGNSVYGRYGRLDEFSFTKDLVSNEKISCMVSGAFNWKYYMDMFADACLRAYDSDKIILIRMNPSDWYIGDEVIKREKETKHSQKVFIKEVENYFIDITRCCEINRAYGYIRNEIDKNTWKFSSLVQDEIAQDIKEIMLNGSEKFFCPYSHKVTRQLYLRLNKSKKSILCQEIKRFDSEIDEVIYRQFLDNSIDDIHAELGKLRRFICDGGTLSEYVRESGGKVDIGVLELYTEYFKLDIDDIVTIFFIYNKIEIKEKMRRVIQNIYKNKECYPVNYMYEFIKRNRNFLLKYGYLDDNLKSEIDSDFVCDMKNCFIRLFNDTVLCIKPNEENMFSLIKWGSYYHGCDKIFDNGMECSVQEIEAVSMDWKFYIRRAKEKKENIPLCCVVKTKDEFLKSLLFLDYSKILESENAIVCLQENTDSVKVAIKKYRSNCTLEPLMSDEARIFYINNGLSDQMNFYVLSKMMQEENGVIPYYDDMYAHEVSAFNGIEIGRVVKEDRENLSRRMISNMVTEQLKKKFWGQMPFPDFLYENGWDDIACLAGREMQCWSGNVFPKKCMCLHLSLFTKDIWTASKNGFFKYYFWHTGTDAYMDDVSKIHKWIELPVAHDEMNKAIYKEMLSCDAVVLHFRCGDYISTQHPDMKFDFYRTCMNEILKIDDYPNKKYYVFADDLNYIKQHENEVGLNLVSQDSIRYMDFNKRKNSIYDLTLMSLGKIILVGNGMFGRKAIQLSTRKEIAISAFPHINRLWEKKGWKNKYSISVTVQ